MPCAASPPEDLKPLTALRFFAAAWVVAYDYAPRLVAHSPQLVARGFLGVEVFFVLSGFILSHVYGRRFGEGGFRYGEFLWARLARIYPVHLATLAGLGLLVGAVRLLGVNEGEDVVRLTSLPGELTLTHAWGLAPASGWNHPSWSLSAEWFAYLAFPAFAAAAWALRRRPRLAVALAVAAGGATYAAFERLAGYPLSAATTAFGWLRIAPPFAYGCALHLVWTRSRRRPAGAALLAVGGLAAGVAAISAGLPDPAVVLCAGGLILGLASLPQAASAGRGTAALTYLGEVSFSLYMMVVPWSLVYEHGARKLLHTEETPLLAPAMWAGLVAGLLPAAMALHHLVERPARAAMRAHGLPLSRRGRARPRPEGDEPAYAPMAPSDAAPSR